MSRNPIADERQQNPNQKTQPQTTVPRDPRHPAHLSRPSLAVFGWPLTVVAHRGSPADYSEIPHLVNSDPPVRALALRHAIVLRKKAIPTSNPFDNPILTRPAPASKAS